MSDNRETDTSSHDQTRQGDVPAIIADLDKLKAQLEQLVPKPREQQQDQGGSEQSP